MVRTAAREVRGGGKTRVTFNILDTDTDQKTL
jgi:hypothetical protein